MEEKGEGDYALFSLDETGINLIIHSIDQSLFASRTIAAIAADADPPPGADDRDPKL